MMRAMKWTASLAVLLAGIGSAQASTITNGSLTVDVDDASGAIIETTWLGTPYWQFGASVIGYGIDSSQLGFSSAGSGGTGGIGATASIVGADIVAVGAYGDLVYTITYSLNANTNQLDVFSSIQNVGTGSVDYTYFHHGDPDQGIPTGDGFVTLNDLTPGDAYSLSTTGWDVHFISGDPTAVLSFIPDSLGIGSAAQLAAVMGAPYDPNGALEDIGMFIGWAATLGAGETLAHNFSMTFSPEAVVPEPASLTLVGLGAFGLVAGAIRRRRQQKA